MNAPWQYVRYAIHDLLAVARVRAVAGILFDIFPPLHSSSPAQHDELNGGSVASVASGRRRRFTNDALVEVAHSLILLTSDGLLLKDLVRERGQNAGAFWSPLLLEVLAGPLRVVDGGGPRPVSLLFLASPGGFEQTS